MLTVTDSAKEVLQSIDHPQGTVLRLEPTQGSDKISLVAGDAGQDDQVIERSGQEVLRVGPTLATVLDGSTIDVAQTPAGPRLSLQRPGEPTA